MVEIMLFGKHKGKSVEQIALADYDYFKYVLNDIEIKKYSLDRRWKHVYHVANNFVSQKDCVVCRKKPAKLISIYTGYGGIRVSGSNFIYCSEDCFDQDPNVTDQMSKVSLLPLTFDTAKSPVKSDTNRLVKIVAACMGLKEGRKTKEYLEEFFDNCPIYGEQAQLF